MICIRKEVAKQRFKWNWRLSSSTVERPDSFPGRPPHALPVSGIVAQQPSTGSGTGA